MKRRHRFVHALFSRAGAARSSSSVRRQGPSAPGLVRRVLAAAVPGPVAAPAAVLAAMLVAAALACAPTASIAQPAGHAAAAAPGAPAGQPTAAFSAQVAVEWFRLTTQLIQQTPGFSPPVASRALAYQGLALYESVVPGMPGHRSLAGQLNELDSLPWAQPDEELHWPTVANAALATMTRMMFPTASAENKTRIDLLERSLPLKHAGDFDATAIAPEVTFRSQSFGRLMAMALMTWARTDGGHEAWGPLKRHQENYVPPSGAGQWSATPPDFAPALLPWWGSNRPFVLRQVADCAAPPPPPYSEDRGSAFFKEAEEVWRIANAATQEQRQFALYWADDPGKTPTPAGHWAFIAGDVLLERQASLADAAQTYARLNLAMADAFIAGWASKYHHHLIRPVTYVQLVIDSQWTPQLMNTPPFPEYPSGHSVQSASAAAVLGAVFGERTAFTDNTHNDRGWGPRRFASFRAAAEEAALSRLYAGIHFRSGVTGGQAQGRCVADKVMALTMRR
jgi:membrane-associated phospholipid phosphatase